MISAREASLKALISYRKSGSWSSLFLNHLIKKENMDAREAALSEMICFGVIQNRRLLDFYLSQFLSKKPEKLDNDVLDILRLSAFQILFLNKIPDSAAVNEGVKLCKKYSNAGAAGLVNAVLRKISVNKESLVQPRSLSIRYSHPEWMEKRFTELWGMEGCEKFLALNNTPPEIFAQVNTVVSDTDTVIRSIEADGFSAEKHPDIPDCIRIQCGNLTKLSAFQRGEFYIQDPAARLAVIASGCKPGNNVIDGCAAPGGKSFSAAVAMQNEGSILSCDIHDNKLSLISSGAERLHLNIIQTRCLDGRTETDLLRSSADVVIADVPCSGLGVIRKKPEIRDKSEKEISGLPSIQLAILSNLSRYVKRRGVLLYSTCTVLPEENENVVSAFLAENPDFRTEAFTLPGKFGECMSGMRTLTPQDDGADGFFICKLRRN